MRLPSRIPSPQIRLPLSFGRRSGEHLVGLDIQPGFVAAVQARVNGSILAERAAALALPPDSVRDGEVVDENALSETLRVLFADSGLGKRVRVGVANQRTVLRTLEVPPVTDQKELAAAVRFQAQDQVPMPLANAVMDFHALGVVDTPAGPRQKVVLVAAQRDMIERLLTTVRRAGLNVEGVDLSAFALIRSLYRRDPEQTGRVLYLNVDGLTNLAIAEGTICRFTRVVGSGLEGMASELAERRGIALEEARGLLASLDLRNGPPGHQAAIPAMPAPLPEPDPEPVAEHYAEPAVEGEPSPQAGEPERDPDERANAYAQELQAAEQGVQMGARGEDHEASMSYEELTEMDEPAAPVVPQADGDVYAVLENGIRDISGEVRNSLDFHRSQEGGGEVSQVVMSGSAQDIPGFAEALQASLGLEVICRQVDVLEDGVPEGVSLHRLAIATGLAASEAPQ